MERSVNSIIGSHSDFQSFPTVRPTYPSRYTKVHQINRNTHIQTSQILFFSYIMGAGWYAEYAPTHIFCSAKRKKLNHSPLSSFSVRQTHQPKDVCRMLDQTLAFLCKSHIATSARNLCAMQETSSTIPLSNMALHSIAFCPCLCLRIIDTSKSKPTISL